MPDSITTANVVQYQANVALLLQQTDSRLRGACTPYQLYGESAEILEQFGQSTAVTGLPRHSDTPLLDVPQDRRWCIPTDVEWGTMEDKQDKLRLIIDPESAYVKVGSAALMRAMDDLVVAAMFGTAKTGKTGSTNTSFPSSQQVANTVGGAAACGLNVAKLREARKILRKAEVDFENETVYVGLCGDVENMLLNEAQVINGDFNNSKPLAVGQISGFAGFTFIHTERFVGGAASAAPGTPYQIPAWVKSGMAFGVWNDLNASVDQRPDKRGAWQVYLKMTCGATRLEEKRVVQILAV